MVTSFASGCGSWFYFTPFSFFWNSHLDVNWPVLSSCNCLAKRLPSLVRNKPEPTNFPPPDLIPQSHSFSWHLAMCKLCRRSSLVYRVINVFLESQHPTNVVIMVHRGASGLREAIRDSLLPPSSQRAGGIIKLTGYLSTYSSAFA